MTGPAFHSFQGQDQFILDACHQKRGGFFLDSGASDGTWGSNTRLLEAQYGWQGICIEPNDALYAQLVRSRSCICLNCCLYDREGPVQFLESAEVYGGILQEYDPEHLRFARSFVASKHGVATPVQKPARTIRSILLEYQAPHIIDYWSLDTEGSELAILRSFPFDEYRIRFITVEHNHSKAREEIARFLAAHGMQPVVELGIDDGYAWIAHHPNEAWRSHAWSRRAGPS